MDSRYQSLYGYMIGRNISASFEKRFNEISEEKFDINQEYQGKPLLHHAVAMGQKEIVLFLLQKGADIHSKQRMSGKSVLHEAIEYPEILELLLLNGADHGIADSGGSTPLHDVINEKSARVLLQYKANPNSKDTNGLTPLHYAVLLSEEPDQLMIVQLLLEHGANADEKDCGGQTPKNMALNLGHMNYFKAMREFKKTPVKLQQEKVTVSAAPSGEPVALNSSSLTLTSVSPKQYDYKSAKDLVMAIQANKSEDEIGKFLNERAHLEDKKGSALYYAISAGLGTVVARILNDTKAVRDKHFYIAGLSVKSLGQDKSKTMYEMVKKYSNEDKVAVPAKTVSPGLHGQSVPDTEVNKLVEAVQGGKMDEVVQFIKTGAHRRDIKGTALYHALALGHEHIVSKLIDAGVEVKDKHIYAAGLSVQHVGERKAKNMYEYLEDYRKPLTHDIEAVESYKILGVAKKAREEQVKAQYRVLAKLYHPDQNKKVDPDVATAQFRKVKEAYDKMMICFKPLASEPPRPSSP